MITKEEESIWIERGIEYYPKDDVILFIRCPKCGRENYMMSVYNGDCAWCGAKGRDYLKKWKDGNKHKNTQDKDT